MEGEIVVSVGDRTIKGTPGTMIFLPRDVQHSFTIESEQSQFFRECAGVLAAAAGGPPDQAKMMEVMRRYGLTPAVG